MITIIFASSKTEVKVRGFSLTYDASQHLTMDRMRELVFAKFAHHEPLDDGEQISFPQICRDKNARVYTRHAKKIYKPVFGKRIVNRYDPNLTTKPYGYVQNNM